MSKYIIELKDDVQVVQKVGVTENGNAFVMNFYKDQLEELTADYINEHFGDLQDDAYERGHGIGYQKGVEDGKAQAERGCEGCMYQDKTIEHHPCGVCCNAYNNRGTAKQTDDEIKVGDEVRRKSAPENERGGIVTKDWENSYFIMWTDGSSGQWDKDRVVKTGRHFDITSILKEMQS